MKTVAGDSGVSVACWAGVSPLANFPLLCKISPFIKASGAGPTMDGRGMVGGMGIHIR